MKPPFDLAPSSLEELHDRIGAAHRRFVELLATTPPATPVGGWTAHEVVAHLVTVMNRYTAFRPDRLAADPRGVDAINERELDVLSAAPLDELLARLSDEMEALHAMWSPASRMALDLPVPFHGGGTLDVQCALTNAMGEFLMHGLDVATLLGRPWPIEPRDGELLCRFATWIVPVYLRRSNAADLDLVIAPDGLEPWTMRVRGAMVEVVAGRVSEGAAPWVSISGSAAEFALLFYARTTGGSLTVDDRRSAALGVPFSLGDYFEAP